MYYSQYRQFNYQSFLINVFPYTPGSSGICETCGKSIVYNKYGFVFKVNNLSLKRGLISTIKLLVIEMNA